MKSILDSILNILIFSKYSLAIITLLISIVAFYYFRKDVRE
ncbi:hypothetical protein [Clostridium sp. HCS.1]